MVDCCKESVKSFEQNTSVIFLISKITLAIIEKCML